MPGSDKELELPYGGNFCRTALLNYRRNLGAKMHRV
jgi:hypothetical protein